MMFDEQPDGDIHGECAAEIKRLEAELELLKVALDDANTQCQKWYLESVRRAKEHNPFYGLWQDAEGKIPVTAVGQPVGRMESPDGEALVQRNAANRPVVREDGTVWFIDKTEWMESE